MKVCFLFLLVAMGIKITRCDNNRVIYFIDPYHRCTERVANATKQCGWKASLDTRVDNIILSGKIITYQIMWQNGTWTDWYVPGINDIDWLFNENDEDCDIPIVANSMRRVWSYFYDHTHRYILCCSLT